MYFSNNSFRPFISSTDLCLSWLDWDALASDVLGFNDSCKMYDLLLL